MPRLDLATVQKTEQSPHTTDASKIVQTTIFRYSGTRTDPRRSPNRVVSELALGDDRRGRFALTDETASQAQRSDNQSQCNSNLFHGSLQ